jgi:RNA polymerase sigma-70 factor (sigma-E family)
VTDESFREFVRVRYAELLRTAFLLSGSAHVAEDLVQTVLLRAYRRWDRIDEPMTYLRRAMVNQRITLWRRFGVHELITEFLPERSTPDSSSALVQRAELLEALRRLPPRMRAVLVLRYWEDLSEAETAEMLGCSAGTVKAQASRGLARLREVLSAGPTQAGKVAEATA